MVYSDFSLIAIVITLLPLSDPLLVHSGQLIHPLITAL